MENSEQPRLIEMQESNSVQVRSVILCQFIYCEILQRVMLEPVVKVTDHIPQSKKSE